jgi:hypothetical protein
MFFGLTLAAAAQGDITDYQTTSHELVFVTGEVSQHLSAYEAKVNMRLVGPVFNDVGRYERHTTTNAPFWTWRDLAESERTMRRSPPFITGWEGLTDETYDWIYYPVLIGWGEYEFAVSIAGEEKRFYLSTLDGNWLDPSFADDNKIIFYVDFRQEEEYDPIEIDIQVYNYETASWIPVNADDRVTFWELHGISRERDRILALSETEDVHFTMAADGITTSIEIPFYNDSHHFDVNVVVLNNVRIPKNKKIIITDYAYEGPTATQYATTRWRFVKTSIIEVEGGELITYSKDALINNGVLPRMAVEFFPLSIAVEDSRDSWRGTRISWHPERTGGLINLRDTWIRYAHTGVAIRGDSARGYINRCWIDSCKIGISVRGAFLSASRDTIRDCEVGVQIMEKRPIDAPSVVIIDSCRIWRSVQDGVRLGVSTWNTVIRNSEIKYNGGHGVFAQNALANIRSCDISKNGWLWGTTLSDNYKGNAGIYQYGGGSILYVQNCDFQSNVGPGIHTTYGTMYARARATEYDTTSIATGLNCFTNNEKSVLADEGSSVYFGRMDDQSGAYTNDRNTLRYPRWREPQSQRWVNLHVRKATHVEMEHNLWRTSTDTWHIEPQSGFVTMRYPLLTADSVRCGDTLGGPIPGLEYEYLPGADVAYLVRLVTGDSLQQAWQHCMATISDQLASEDAAVYSWALLTMRLLGDLDSSQIVLESKAFGNGNASLANHALLDLRALYMIMGDSSSAWRVLDTLSARLPIEELADDSLTLELYRSDLLWYINQDTVAAATHITDLHAARPGDVSVRTRYVHITGDTTAYWYGAVDEMDKPSRHTAVESASAGLEILSCHPNPFNPTTQIHFHVAEPSQLELFVYSIEGRLVDARSLGARSSGLHYYQYHAGALPSGVYVAVLTNGREQVSFRLVLEK